MEPVDEKTMWKGGIGTVPQAQNPGGVPPELEKIIERIMNAKNSFGGALSGGRKVEALSNIASTIGGITQQGMRETGDTNRTGIAEAGAMDRLKISEAGDTARLGITEAGLNKRNDATQTISPFLKDLISDKAARSREPAASPVPALTPAASKKKYYESFPDFKNYFK